MPDLTQCPQCGTKLSLGVLGDICPNCVLKAAFEFAPEAKSDSPLAGKRLGDYELLEEIARGGMGVIYKARQVSLERVVAIKMILSGQFAGKEELLRFRAEAESSARLQHPNIVRIHETGEVDGQPYFSMDCVEGTNLAALVRDRPLSAKRAATYVKKVAQAIHYAHEHGILHRDLKPSNILIDEQDEPRITDFGLAKRVQKESFLTVTGQVMGSPGFMPPEQAGVKVKAGRYSDVYGLGANLYYLLTGRAPFHGESIEATLHQVLSAEPVSPRLLNPAVPLDLETIVLRCLEKSPSRRYATARELAEELERFVRDEPITARPAGRIEKGWRWSQRNPQLSAALATVVILFFLGFGISLWQWYRAEVGRAAARLNLYVSDINLAYQALRQGKSSFALAKLRNHIPRPGDRSDLRGWEWRYLWRLCQPTDLFTVPGDKPVTAVALSPGGTWLATANIDGEVNIWEMAQRRLFTNLLGSAYAPSQPSIAFSQSGALLAIVKDGRIVLFRTDTWGLDRVLVPTKNAKLFAVTFSADGSNVLATSSIGLHAWSIKSDQEVAKPVLFKGDGQHLACSKDGRWLAMSSNGVVIAWDLRTRAEVLHQEVGEKPVQLGEKPVAPLALSPAGLLATCDRHGNIQVWDLARGQSGEGHQLEWEWKTPGSTIYAVAFSPDGSILATGGSDQMIHLWQMTNGQRIMSFLGHQREVWSLAFSGDGKQLVSGGKDGLTKAWNPGQLPPSESLPGTRYPLSFSTNSRTIATLSPARVLQFWDVATCTLTETFHPPADLRPTFVEITPDMLTVVLKTSSNIIHIFDARTQQSRGVLKLDRTNLRAAMPRLCSPDSRFVAVGTERDSATGKARAVELFDLMTCERVSVVPDLALPLRFSPDGRYLAARVASGDPAIWDIKKGRMVHVFRDSEGDTKYAAFSWNGKFFAASSTDDTIRIWDMRSKRLHAHLTGHSEGIGKIAFSRDNRTLFSTSTDETVKFWNVANGQEMMSVTEYGTDTFELLLSHDDQVLAVGGLELESPPIKLWHAPSLRDIDAHRAKGSL